MPNFSIGVDLGGTNLRIAAVNQQGDLMEKVTLGTRVGLGKDHVIHEMCDAIRLLAAKYRDGAALQGIGIGVPGIIDMKTGMLRESPNLPGWAESPVQAQIEGLLGTRVILENDANVAALGEKWLGAARDVDDMAMLTLGTGVGGGIVIQGRIWHGMTGMAGEFGHMTVEPEGPPCGCGNRGCLEQYASATAVVRMAKEAIASGRAPGLAKAANTDRRVQRQGNLQPGDPGRGRGPENLWAFGTRPWNLHCESGQRLQSEYVRGWRRSVERVGSVLPIYFRGTAAALSGLCRNRSRVSFGR